MSKWLNRRNRKKAHRHARRRASHSALQLETLEDRRLLAIVTWDGGGAADNWSEAANWSADTLPGNSDTVVFDATSTKNAAVDAAFGGTIKELQINTGYTGTIALDRNLTVNGNFAQSDGNFDFDTGMHTLAVDGNFTVTAAAGFDAGDGTVEFSWNQVHTSVDSAAPFNDVVFSRASGFSITANQMDVNGDLVIQQVGGINGTISVAGNVTTHDTSVKGTGKILFDGSGNQVLSAAVDGGEVAGIEIDKPSGTLTISAPDKLRVSGSWTQSAGSVQLNVPTVEFSWNQIHTSVDSFVPFNDVVFARSSGFSITANQMDVNGDLVIQQMGGINGTVSAAGNVTTHDTRVTGSGKILLDGTGDQVLSAAVDRGEVPGIEIDKPSGTLTIDAPETLTVSGSWKQVAGTVQIDAPTVEFSWVQIHTSVDSAAPFNDVVFNRASGFQVTVTQMDIDGDLAIRGNNNRLTGMITVAGNVTSYNSSVGGNGTIVMDGSQDAVLTGDGADLPNGGVNIDKSGGATVTLGSDIEVSSMRVNQGTLDLDGRQLTVSGGTLAVEPAGTVAIHLNDAAPTQAAVTGGVSLGGTLDVNLAGGYVPDFGEQLTFIDNDQADAVSGTFAGLAEGATFSVGDSDFQISYSSGTGNDVALTSIVPTDAIYGVKSANGPLPLYSQTPSHLFRFNADGTGFVDSGTITLSGSAIDVDALAASQQHGLLGFRVTGSSSQLISIHPGTAEATAIGSTLSGRQIRGATFDGFDQLWVLDSANNSVLQIDPTTGQPISGTEKTLFLPGGSAQITGVFNVNDIAVRSDGNFYVATLHSSQNGTTFYNLDVSTGELSVVGTDTSNGGDGAAPQTAGIAFAAGAPHDRLFTYEVAYNDGLYRYNVDSGFSRSTISPAIITSYNAGRGDLAGVIMNAPPSAGDDTGATFADTPLTGISGYSGAVLEDNPLAYWRLNEAAGAIIHDASGNNHDGTISGAVSLGQPGATDDSDTAAEFSGGSITFPTVTGLRDNFSVEFWIKPDSASNYNQGIGHGWGQFNFHTGTGGKVWTGAECCDSNQRFNDADLGVGTMEIGTWQHFTFTFEDLNASQGTATLYKNGVLLAQRALDKGSPWTSFDLRNSLDGIVDEVAVYDYALSAERVEVHFNGQSGLLANDVDPNPTDSISVTAFDATSALGAAVNVNPDGSFTYDPTASATLAALKTGEMADDTFTYTISDGIATDTATVTVTVSGVAPNAIDDVGSTDADTLLTVDALANVPLVNGDFETDADLFVDWPGYVGNSGPSGTNPSEITGWSRTGSQIGINSVAPPPEGDGGFPFRNNGANLSHVVFIQRTGSLSQVVSGLTAGGEYELTFEYNVRAGFNNTNVTVSIAGATFADTNVAPVQAAGSYTVPYHQGSLVFTAGSTSETLTVGSISTGGDATSLFDNFSLNSTRGGVMTNDEGRSPLSVSSFDATSTLGASVSVNPDGGYTYDPTTSASLSTLPFGNTVVDTFTYTITDGVHTDSATVSITVTGTSLNSPPQIDAQSFDVDENQTSVGTVIASDPDLPNDTLTFVLTGNGPDDGKFAITAGGALHFVAGPDYESPADIGGSVGDNVYEVEVQVADSANEAATAVITVTVDPANDNAPAFTSPAFEAIPENTTAVQTLSATDADLPAQSVVFLITGDGSDDALFQIVGGNQLEFITSPDYETPADGDADNVYEVQIEADDNNGLTTKQTVLVSVTPVNDNAPLFTSPTTASVTENTTAVQNVSATDADLPAQSVTYSIAGSGPDNALFQIVGGNQLEFIAPPDYETPLDADEDNIYEVEIEADDNNGLTTTQTVQVSVLNQASITGTVFVDVNENGLYDANEPGIDGVVIELLDELGAPVLDDLGTPITATTSGGGFYLFEDLDPGVYQVFENQPTGVDDGAEHLGSLGGAAVANDTMQLTLDRTDAADYVFAELGQQVTSGDTATIGFWQNKHGQELIAQGGTALADWLTDNFGNVFGDELAGVSGSDVASFYKGQLFKQKGKKSAGPAKVDAQFMATALATYFTSSNLAGAVAAGYGFNVTQTGIGTKIVNVGSNGAAFNVADNTDLTIMQLLVATNDLTDLPDGISGFAHIYDANGDGVIDSDEASLRSMANEVYNGINEDGEV